MKELLRGAFVATYVVAGAYLSYYGYELAKTTIDTTIAPYYQYSLVTEDTTQ